MNDCSGPLWLLSLSRWSSGGALKGAPVAENDYIFLKNGLMKFHKVFFEKRTRRLHSSTNHYHCANERKKGLWGDPTDSMPLPALQSLEILQDSVRSVFCYCEKQFSCLLSVNNHMCSDRMLHLKRERKPKVEKRKSMKKNLLQPCSISFMWEGALIRAGFTSWQTCSIFFFNLNSDSSS